jgi:phycobilisome rod-core linker protein
MPIPLQAYPLTSQNSRVSNLAGDIDSIRNTFTGSIGAGDANYRADLDALIEQAYRQIYFHAMQADRDPYLESQLRSGNITMRDFVRGLLLSERFQQGYYQCSSNYRMVDQVVGRVLGRPVHGEEERLAWSIVIGDQGFNAFVDSLLDSAEYMESFGYDLPPQQRGRVVPGRVIGDMPIYQRFPRYGSEWRNALVERGCTSRADNDDDMQTSLTWTNGQPPTWALRLWLTLIVLGGFEICRIVITIAASILKT